jgi:serine protease
MFNPENLSSIRLVPSGSSQRGAYWLHNALAMTLLCWAASVGSQARAATPAAESSVSTVAAEDPTDRLIIQYRRPATSSAMTASHPIAQRLKSAGVTWRTARRNAQGAWVVQLDSARSPDEMRRLARQLSSGDSSIAFAEPDYRIHALATPVDPYYGYQWHYYETVGGIRAPGAWDMSTGEGVVVGVIDTGVRPHEDLVANLLDGYDFVSSTSISQDGDGRDADAMDPGDGCNGRASSWHGTHVSGTIAAVAGNGLGGVGVAWNAKILPARALGCGGGYLSDAADALLWLAGASVSGVDPPSRTARVVNMSLGSRASCSSTMQAAIDTARALGTVVVAAAGNDGQSALQSTPANCKGVIAVSAIGRNGLRASYSNYGANVDIAAPGGVMTTTARNGILSTVNSGTSTPVQDIYGFLQGTSMAAPHVSGVAALMLARNPNLTPDEIETLIKSNARAFPSSCSGCGAGIVNATASVNAVLLGSAVSPDSTETEPNNTLAQAQAISSIPVRILGTIATTSDVDMYAVQVLPGQTVKARLMANVGSNYSLAMRNAKNVVVASSARAQGLTDVVTWTYKGTTATTFYLIVTRVSGGVGSVEGTYTLEIVR